MSLPVLYEDQIPHTKRLEECLNKYGYACDASAPGAGKTHPASYIAVKYDLPVFPLGPGASLTRQTWEEAFTKYELKKAEFDFMTYETLRSTGNSQPKHGLLRKEKVDKVVNFYPTDKLKDMLRKKKYLFIFDECQILRNRNLTHSAARALILTALRYNSWVLLLSGSLVDKMTQHINFLHVLGIVSNPWIYTNRFGNIDTAGREELDGWIRRTSRRDEFETFRLDHQFIANPVLANNYIRECFVRFFKPEIISIMPKHIAKDEDGNYIATLDIKNGFYKLGKRETILYEEAISAAAQMLNYGDIYRPLNIMGVTSRLLAIQEIKASAMIRIAIRDLEEREKNYKVIIYCNYDRVIDNLLTNLNQYDPICLCGKVKLDERERLINIFKEDNGKRRLLIANTAVGSKSVNLQDLTGKYPRRMYIFPSYFVNDLQQASQRTYRVGTVGLAYVRFFYGITRTGLTESSLLDTILKSGKAMAEVLREQNIIFPNDYESEYEGELEEETEEDLLEKLRKLAMDD